MVQNPYYLERLRSDFSKRQRVNQSYSLRAFARQLKIQPPTLSAVMKGKRRLPQKRAVEIAGRLGLSPSEHQEFILSVAGMDGQRIQSDTRRVLEEEAHFKVISEWEHYAALSLFDTVGFRPTKENFSAKLKIARIRVETVLSNLVRSGLLAHENGRYVRSVSGVKTTEDMASTALRVAHTESLDLAKEKLISVAIDRRDFSSCTVAVDMAKLPEAKELIRNFRQQLTKLVETGKPKEVYQLCVQFYPLTGGL